MDYELSDSSGTDDDLPPPNRIRFQSGVRTAGNVGSAAVGSSSLPKMKNDMETQIHNIEQEAYGSVLRAFKAQSDAITWEKESLITELRRELRISDEEHRKLLSRVDADEIIWRIREWRKTSWNQLGMRSTGQPTRDHSPRLTVSASRKKHKTSQSFASLSIGALSPVLQPSMHPSTFNIRNSPPPGPRNKNSRSNLSAGLDRRSQVPNCGSSAAAFTAKDKTGNDQLVGRKVWTRLPDNNHFYEAVITDCNPVEGRHALVYDKNTVNETWEWVNLSEIPPEDIKWGSEDIGTFHNAGQPGAGRGNKFISHGGAVGQNGRSGSLITSQPIKDFPTSHSGIRKNSLGDIEILHTDTLIKEVEKVFSAGCPDPLEIENATKVLNEHEQALVDAIARLEDVSDGESDEEDQQLSLGQSLDHDGGSRR